MSGGDLLATGNESSSCPRTTPRLACRRRQPLRRSSATAFERVRRHGCRGPLAIAPLRTSRARAAALALWIAASIDIVGLAWPRRPFNGRLEPKMLRTSCVGRRRQRALIHVADERGIEVTTAWRHSEPCGDAGCSRGRRQPIACRAAVLPGRRVGGVRRRRGHRTTASSAPLVAKALRVALRATAPAYSALRRGVASIDVTRWRR